MDQTEVERRLTMLKKKQEGERARCKKYYDAHREEILQKARDKRAHDREKQGLAPTPRRGKSASQKTNLVNRIKFTTFDNERFEQLNNIIDILVEDMKNTGNIEDDEYINKVIDDNNPQTDVETDVTNSDFPGYTDSDDSGGYTDSD